VSPLWIVPPAVLLAGLALVLTLLRSVDAESRDARAQLRRFGEVRRALATVRADNERSRASLDALRQR